jgi:hypothetical protein
MIAATSLGPLSQKIAYAESDSDVDVERPAMQRDSLAVNAGDYSRSVAEDYMVLPSGQELSTQLRFVTADQSLGDSALKFSDLALFDIAANVALGHKFAINAALVTLPKQPSFTSEHVFQSASLGVRRQVGSRYAVAAQVAAGPLLGVRGEWGASSLALQHRRHVGESVSFEFSGGADGNMMAPKGGARSSLVEVSGKFSAVVNDGHGIWAGWIGAGYAVPVFSRGNAINGMSSAELSNGAMDVKLDPQPRLDFTIGTGVRVGKLWDMYATYTVIDRGETSRPQTLLPILDGGFDQRQIIFGLSRRLDWSLSHKSKQVSHPMMML